MYGFCTLTLSPCPCYNTTMYSDPNQVSMAATIKHRVSVYYNVAYVVKDHLNLETLNSSSYSEY